MDAGRRRVHLLLTWNLGGGDLKKGGTYQIILIPRIKDLLFFYSECCRVISKNNLKRLKRVSNSISSPISPENSWRRPWTRNIIE
jgi:hypothetical protein